MKYMKMLVFINNETETNIKNYLNGKIDSVGDELRTRITLKNDTKVILSFVYEGLEIDGKNKIRITCDAGEDEHKRKTKYYEIDNYSHFYEIFEVEYKNVIYSLFVRPTLTDNNPDDIYFKLKNIYISESLSPLISAIKHTRLNDIEEKMYLCILLYIINISNYNLSDHIENLLKEKLTYYGYDMFDEKTIEKELRTVDENNVELFTNTFLKYAYALLNGDFTLNVDDYEFCAKKLINKYLKEFWIK